MKSLTNLLKSEQKINFYAPAKMKKFFLFLMVIQALSFAQLRRFDVEVTRKDTVIVLPNRFIIPQSEVISTMSRILLNGRDYTIDYDYGRLYIKSEFFNSISDSAVRLSIIYKTFPFSEGKKFFRYKSISVFDTSFSRRNFFKLERREDDFISFGSNLQKSGSLVRGFTFGSNRDLTLQSGFNLQFSGNLTRDVEVVASLTDENIPIQPEGNTQTLQEIDKIFVQLRSKNLSATFGDYDIGFMLSDEQGVYLRNQSEFAQVKRRLQGGKFQASFENDFFKTLNTFAFASSRGKYATNYFNGIDGLQGPYRLTGANGERDIIVIAGTERVYVDGELMTRGEMNDYVIDYASAEITFTPNRLITSSSRITVDFQYADRKYLRNFIAFISDNLIFDEHLNIGVSYFYDGDSKNSPIDLILSPSDVEILKASGDDNLKAVKNGAVYVGFDSTKGIGRGQYVKKDTLIDSKIVEIYIYAPGDKNALYSVRFSYVGEGKGDYVRKGIGWYEYVGKNKGAYLPVVFLPMPERKQLVDVNAIYKSEKLNFFVETAFSDYDRNLFSELDDKDNRGYAFKYGAGYSIGSDSGNFFRKIDLRVFQRIRSRSFSAIDRFDEVEFWRKWNLPASGFSGDEIITQGEIGIEFLKRSSLSSGYGTYRLGDSLRTGRSFVEVKILEQRAPTFTGKFEYLKTGAITFNSDWVRGKGGIGYGFKVLKPFLNYEFERRENFIGDSLLAGSFSFWRVVPGFVFVFDRLNGEVSHEVRFDYIPNGNKFILQSIMRNQNYRLAFSGGNFNLNADFAVNRKKFFNQVSSDVNNILARLSGRGEFVKRALRFNFLYRTMTRKISKLEPVFVKVQRGNGNYRYIGDLNNNGLQDPSEFEPTKYDGDYIMLTVQSGEYIPATSVDASLSLRFYPERILNKDKILGKIFSSISTDTYFQVSENSTERAERIYLMRLNYFQQRGKTISGILNFRQDLYLFENDPKFSLRFRYSNLRAMSSYSLALRSNATIERSARLRWSPAVDMSFQADLFFVKKFSTGGFRETDSYDIRSAGLNFENYYKPYRFVEVGFRFGFSRNRDVAFGREASLNRQGVKLGWLFAGRGRVDFEIERNEVDVKNSSSVIPFELVEGNSVGKNFFVRINGIYSVGDYIQVSGGYDGRFLSGRESIHIARVEVRLYF